MGRIVMEADKLADIGGDRGRDAVGDAAVTPADAFRIFRFVVLGIEDEQVAIRTNSTSCA